MSIVSLIVIFFKVGLFTIGGGLASLGLLHEYLVEPGYISSDLFYNMVAVSQSTPGPIGINMATYIGFEYYGFLGAVIATFALVLPSFIIITLIAFTLDKINENGLVVSAFKGFRPAALAIILSVTYMLINTSVIPLGSELELSGALIIKCALCLLTVLFALKYNLHPLLCILGGAIAGAFLL